MSNKLISKIALKFRAVNAFAITGAAVLTSLSPAAFAGEYDEAVKVEVTIAVAELQFPTGAEVVYEKLLTAAQDACLVEGAFMTERMMKSCTADLLDQFVDDLSKAEVTALHNTRDA